jgi:hypothetical protein
MSKYKSFNAATVRFVAWLEAEIFANREKLIIINAPPLRLSQENEHAAAKKTT